MSGIKLIYDAINQKGTPLLYTDVLAERPAYGIKGRLFFSTDTGQIFEDNGTSWSLLADAGAGGGSLETVTLNGNTTDQGIVITANGLSSNSVTIPTLTPGSLVFGGTSNQLQQDNSNLFYDDSNNRLGIGTTTPGTPLDIHSPQNNILSLNNISSGSSYILFQENNTTYFKVGYTSSDGNFEIQNVNLFSTSISINAGNNITTFGGYSQFLQGISLGAYGTSVGTNSTAINFYSQSGTYRYDAYTDAGGNFQLLANGTSSNLSISQAGLTTIYKGIGVNGYAASASYAALFDGSVGVGTNAPQNFGGTFNTLEVQGSSGGYVLATNSGASTIAQMGVGSNVAYYGLRTAGTVTFTNNNSEVFRISSSSNLLVNTTTDSGQKLQVNGSGLFNGSLAIGNTVTASVNNVVTNKVAIVINGTQYYLLASTSSI